MSAALALSCALAGGLPHLEDLVNLCFKVHVQQLVRLIQHQVLQSLQGKALGKAIHTHTCYVRCRCEGTSAKYRWQEGGADEERQASWFKGPCRLLRYMAGHHSCIHPGMWLHTAFTQLLTIDGTASCMGQGVHTSSCIRNVQVSIISQPSPPCCLSPWCWSGGPLHAQGCRR
jgi:hypothetical protein